jgi:hypothetical protein
MRLFLRLVKYGNAYSCLKQYFHPNGGNLHTIKALKVKQQLAEGVVTKTHLRCSSYAKKGLSPSQKLQFCK